MGAKPQATKPVRIALTGGIGSGKSTALLMFAARGAAVLDSDELVHGLLERPEVRSQIADSLGLEPIPSGEEGRRRIAQQVFGNVEQLKKLEQILFPLVKAEIEAWLSGLTEHEKGLAVVELPMLFEAGMEDDFDYIVLVTAPEEIRMRRHEGRVGLTDFEERASRQLPEAVKRKRSDFIYDNVDSPDGLDEFVAATIASLANDASGSGNES